MSEVRLKNSNKHFEDQSEVVLFLIIIMQLENNLFLKTAQKVTKQSFFYEILEYQDSRLEFKPFKVEKLSPEKASQTYLRIFKKYEAVKDFKIQPEAWLESEKRLFAWFIVFYTYLNRDQAGIKTDLDFPALSRAFFGKCPHFLEFHFLILLKTSQKICWDQQKDKMLLEIIKSEGMKWNEISRHIFMNTGKKVFRSPKSCRERWLNHLDLTKIKGNWTGEQDLLIFENVVQNTGKKWSKLVGLLGNKRTEHTIKNRFNALIAKNRRYKLEKDLKVAQRILSALRGKAGLQDMNGDVQKRNEEDFHKIEESNSSISDQKFKMEVFSEQNEYNQQLVEQNSEKNVNIRVQSKHEEASSEIFPFLLLAKQEIQLKQPYIQPKQQHLSPISKQRPEGFELNDCWGRAIEREDVFPFENYSYQASIFNNYTSQIMEYHKNQMMFYQQLMALPQRPTNDTNFNTREAKIIEERKKKQEKKEQEEFLS